MDNNINFTGIRNIGTMGAMVVDFRNLKPLQRKYLVAQLTNDQFGYDYDCYQKALQSCSDVIGDCKFPHDKTFIHVFTEKTPGKNELPKLFLNLKEIPVQRETVKLYQFLAKLTKSLANMKPKDYVIRNDFKYGPDGDLFIMGDSKVSEICKNLDDYLENIRNIYSAESVKSYSELINNDIQIKMEDYLL